MDEKRYRVTLTAVRNANPPTGGARRQTGWIRDDDERGVTVTPTALSIPEGGTGGYTVVLTSQPTAEVTVEVNVPAGADLSVDRTSLTFTAAD